MTSQLTCQTTSINLTNKQAKEIYKGLKQGEYLKERLRLTEESLNHAKTLITAQNETIEKQSEVIDMNKQIIDNISFQRQQEKDIHSNNIERLQHTLEKETALFKKQKKESFWRGFKYGTILALVTTTVFLVTK